MIVLGIIFKLCILTEWISANPLMQSVQPFPITNYQPSLYLQPYSEALYFQPSNINTYSPHVVVQNPLPTYQSLPVSSTDQIIQTYWDKLLSNPNIRRILDPDYVYYNDNIKEILKNVQNPLNSGGVVNNYIIIPPENVKKNESVRENNVKSVDLRNPNKETVCYDHRKKKVRTDCNTMGKDVLCNNITSQKHKKNVEKRAKKIHSDSIKCYRPADVLDDRDINPEKKTRKTKQLKKECKKGNAPKRDNLRNKYSEKSEIKTNKPKSSKKKITKKKSALSKGNECKNKRTTTKKKCKPALDDDKCIKHSTPMDDIITVDDETVNEKEIAPNCNIDFDEIFNLKHDCTHLENRCIRNSKSDAALKEFRMTFPDLPDDLAKNYVGYLNDFFSSQQVPNSNLFPGNNMYPYDFTQLYQIPQYSNTDSSKSSGNKGKNRNSKRKKKQKKKNSTKKKKEGGDDYIAVTDSENLDILEEPETLIEVAPTATKTNTTETNIHSNVDKTTPAISATERYIYIVRDSDSLAKLGLPIDIKKEKNHDDYKQYDTIPSKNFENNLQKELETIVATAAKENFADTTITTVAENPDILTGISSTQLKSSESITQPDDTRDAKQILNNGDVNKVEVTMVKLPVETPEIYETQIPETMSVDEINQDKINTNKIEVLNELDWYNFDQAPALDSEIKILNIFDDKLFKDYFPDFTADNHAYLGSSEEIEFRNIHGRYFYASDKNIDSGETDYIPIGPTKILEEETVYDEDRSDNDDSMLLTDKTKTSYKALDKSEEIVFRTPPGLDAPGFRTRKVNRERQDSAEVYYQHDNSEDDYDRYNMDSFADRSNQYYKMSERNINQSDHDETVVETVYAGSKVVKYGQNQDTNKPVKPKVINQLAKVDNDDIHYDGDKIVVLAKSLGDQDVW